MSEILNDLPEVINPQDQILNSSPIPEVKTFIVAGIQYTADLNRLTRGNKKQAEKLFYAGATFKNGQPSDESTLLLVENTAIVSDYLVKIVFNIPESINLDNLIASEIEPLIDYVDDLDILGIKKARAKAGL
jgi:hypothetical protein